jgi:hypothetical protein
MKALGVLVVLVAALLLGGAVVGWLAGVLGEGSAVLVAAVVLLVGWLLYARSDRAARRELQGWPGGRFTARGWVPDDEAQP